MKQIDHYDDKSWGGEKTKRELLQREAQALRLIREADQRAPIGRFLDIGCGAGFFLNLVRQVLPKASLYGVDYSKTQLEQAGENPFDLRWCDLGEGIPFGDGEFECAYAGEVIEHLYNPDFFLDECRRILAPKGTLLITTPNLQAWYNRALFLLGIQPLFYEVSTKSSLIGSGPLKRLKRGSIPVGHLRLFNKTALKEILEFHGFSLRTLKGSVFPYFPAPLVMLDRFFTPCPSLASNFVAFAEKN